MSCVSSSSIFVLTNGSPSAPLIPLRGIHEGDPISPYLYILCIEVLSRKIEHSIHLMFADDLLFFGEAYMETISTIKEILYDFSLESRLSANPQKFTLCFSRNAIVAIKKALSDLLSITVSDCLGPYLGFPLQDKRPSLSTLHEITRKISSRLASWKSKLLSKAGRLVLINSTLNSIPSNISSCIRFRKALSSRIDQIS
ncbi:unnamed protein product [Amaranthus hypochondriacus]